MGESDVVMIPPLDDCPAPRVIEGEEVRGGRDSSMLEGVPTLRVIGRKAAGHPTNALGCYCD
jgi:hypothetical protein